MFEAFRKPGSHRVDYLNQDTMGTEGAFAFYVCGDVPKNAPYSQVAKRSLLAGLSLIQDTLGPENLVAVYLDVFSADHLSRPAYKQLKDDMRSGMFRRVFVLRASDLVGERHTAEDLKRLYHEVGGFDLLTYNDGAFKPVMLSSTGSLA